MPFAEPEVERELFAGPRDLDVAPPFERDEDGFADEELPPDLPDADLPRDAPVLDDPAFDEARLPPALALVADDLPPPADDLPDAALPDDRDPDAPPLDLEAVDLDEPPPLAFDDAPPERVPFVDELPRDADDPLLADPLFDDADRPLVEDDPLFEEDEPLFEPAARDVGDPLLEPPLRADVFDLPDVALPLFVDPAFDAPVFADGERDFDDEPDFADDEPDLDDEPGLELLDELDLEEPDDLLPPLLPDDDFLVGIMSSLSCCIYMLPTSP